MFNKLVRLVCFALGGHTEWYEPTRDERGRISTSGHLEGYDRADTWVPDEGIEYPDGTPVLDKCAVLRENPGLAFRSPLLQVGCGEWQKMDTVVDEPLLSALASPQSFGVLALMCNQEARSADVRKEPGPFDYVDVPYFVEWWRKQGARYGTIVNRQIVWEG